MQRGAAKNSLYTVGPISNYSQLFSLCTLQTTHSSRTLAPVDTIDLTGLSSGTFELSSTLTGSIYL